MGYLENTRAKYSRLRQSPQDSGAPSGVFAFQRHALLATIAMAFVIGFLVGRKEITPVLFSSISYKLSETIGLSPNLPMDHWIGMLTKERILLEDRLMSTEYGNTFYAQLFEPTQLSMFETTDESRAHLKRRLKIKFLSKLVHPLQPNNFVWATAGDSIAAGHGNMFNQSYTAMLEDTVGAAFASVGINFVTRNYGMSFYSSGPELALCMEAIYGKDVDLLSWDFLLHDSNPQRMRLWGQRAMGHPKKPTLFFFVPNDGERQPYLQELDDQGLSVFAYDIGEAENAVRQKIPETTPVEDPSQQLPPALEHLVCTQGSLEGIFPCSDGVRYGFCEHTVAQQCLAHKYDTPPDCTSNQHSHHPGWKLHLLRGRLLGHYMIQLLEESIMEIDEIGGGRSPSSWQRILLDQLNREESAYLHQLEKKKPSPASDDSYAVEGVPNSASIIRELGVPNLFRAPSICHTALLPAESRYKGYVTMSDQVGDWRDGNFDIGTNKIKAFQWAVDSSHGPLQPWHSPLLVYEMGDRHRCSSPKIDHKDYFLVRNTEKDWLHMYVPTETEMQVYHHSGKPPLQGILIVCVAHCPNDMCPPEHVHLNNERKETWVEIQVDGQPIKKVLPLDGTCSILENKHGVRWGSQTNYRVSFKVVTKKQGFDYLFKISSVIVL
mmetsp:Transcript_6249/g.9013  ORF Transcript_6249/g.9013 Transcript_6249/m.9013 type:complete len:662 (-) Transcript_6249:72-2057(-)|eukprot:CAMPEP_0194068866 /NCGR_PEP_ID=MMETSP0009_2-20130614/87327_1 /TAXON_ID=210454 /ORGANISM="Grammatophora oceanica, Strain CCMP 410" /LENGTH=661 /DNA_ID=CAMNT_0038722001 /DNA_START=94 /DNA_END=2079 /DNA_ORIENTATION=+